VSRLEHVELSLIIMEGETPKELPVTTQEEIKKIINDSPINKPKLIWGVNIQCGIRPHFDDEMRENLTVPSLGENIPTQPVCNSIEKTD